MNAYFCCEWDFGWGIGLCCLVLNMLVRLLSFRDDLELIVLENVFN